MKDPYSPLVSILTPSFNQGAWLEDNLKSVQTQTYRNVEHIVMDGGSTDNTLEILRNAPTNVAWKSEPDRGQSHALNKAFSQSTGDIVGWINSDDAYIDRRAIEAAVREFERDPNIGVVYGHGLVLDENNQFVISLWSPNFVDRFLQLGVLFLQPSLFFRRSMLPELLIREELNYVMDWDLFLRLRNNGVGFKRIPLIVGLDRMQPDRKTMDFTELDEEFGEVAARYGIPHNRRTKVEKRLIGAARRWAGLPLAARFIGKVDPTIEINTLSTGRRIFNQGLLPRMKIRPPQF